jgi:hypothetical protein
MQPKIKKEPKIIVFGPELREDFFLAPPPQSGLQGRLPSPPASPQSQRQHLYWHETVLCWNSSDDFKWTLIEYFPCLLGIIWNETVLGAIEQLTCFPPQAQYYFVKGHEQVSFPSSSSRSYQSIFASQETSSYRARHLRRFSEPELPGPRYFDPQGITQNSWLFTKFLGKILNLTTVSCTCLILSLKFAQIYYRKKLASSTAEQMEDNQFRIFVVSIMLANKYTEDHPYTSKAWSTLSGMPIYEINEMECDFLSLLAHELYVSESEFRAWTVTLQNLCQWRLPSPAYIEQSYTERKIKHLVPSGQVSGKHSSFWSRFKNWRNK